MMATGRSQRLDRVRKLSCKLGVAVTSKSRLISRWQNLIMLYWCLAEDYWCRCQPVTCGTSPGGRQCIAAFFCRPGQYCILVCVRSKGRRYLSVSLPCEIRFAILTVRLSQTLNAQASEQESRQDLVGSCMGDDQHDY
jgi:hypothetical protein